MVKLVIFQDGLQLGEDPARPYEDATATAVLCDIFDGYFPSILKRDYPDGVAIDLVDCSQTSVAAAAGAEGSSWKRAGSGKVHSFFELGKASTYLEKVRDVCHLVYSSNEECSMAS
jgi:hypothetical protein